MASKAVIFTGLVNIDKNLVGTAIIYKKLADLLIKKGYQVSMVTPGETDITGTKIKFHLYEEENNQKLISSSGLVIFGAYPPPQPLWTAYQKKKTIVTYLWSVAPVGSLEFKDFSSRQKQKELHQYITASFNLSLLLSDKIFCRDRQVQTLLWGSLASLGRVNLDNYLQHKKLRNIIEEAPFGLDKGLPKHKQDVYRGRYEAIGQDDFLLIWNGGVWNWNDGQTLIKAMKKVDKENIKLIFQGFKHPDKGQRLSQEAKKTLEAAKGRGLLDKNVFFPDKWIPFAQRGNYLTECDAGVVSSPDIPEANLFLKTRIYDYLWAELPVILNDCEAFAPVIREKGLGLVVKTGDAGDWAKKIMEIRNNKKLKNEIIENIRAYKKELTWDKALKPIEKYLDKPSKLRDKYDNKNRLLQENIDSNKKIINI